MDPTALVALIAAVLAALATAFAARQNRQVNTASVDVRVFEALQAEVVALQARLNEVRAALYSTQDALDAERRTRRELNERVVSLEKGIASGQS